MILDTVIGPLDFKLAYPANFSVDRHIGYVNNTKPAILKDLEAFINETEFNADHYDLEFTVNNKTYKGFHVCVKLNNDFSTISSIRYWVEWSNDPLTSAANKKLHIDLDWLITEFILQNKDIMRAERIAEYKENIRESLATVQDNINAGLEVLNNAN